MNNIKKFVKLILFAMPSYLIPKKKGYYVFHPTRDPKHFHSNIKATLLYLQQSHPEIDTAIIMPFKEGIEEAEEYGVTIKKSYLSRVWALYRAQYIFIDASTILYAYWKVSLIQLWHGSGFKSVGILQENMDPVNRKYYKKVYKNYVLCATTSEDNRKQQNASFGISTSQVTGYPRNDIFYDKSIALDQIRTTYGLKPYSQIITYAPTHRQMRTSEAFSSGFWKELNEILKSKNQVFVIKKHVKDKHFVVPKGYSHIIDLTEDVSEVQNLLLITDILVSDYSSIMTDFAITERPILVYAYDLEYYSKDRSMYYDLEKVLPKPILKTEQELLNALTTENWSTEEYRESYNNFKKVFHQYLDDNSSKRVVEAVLNL